MTATYRLVVSVVVAVTLLGFGCATESTYDTGADVVDGKPIDIVIEEFGFGTIEPERRDAFASYGIIVRNPNNGRWIANDVSIAITWIDESGSVLGRDTGSIYMVLPTEVAAVTGRTFDMEAAEVAIMEVQTRVGSWIDSGEGPLGSFEVSDVTLREDTVTARVSSTFDREFTDLDALAIFRDSDGNIVGGWGYAYIDFIAGGGNTSVEVNRPSEIQASSADVFVQATW